MLKRRIIGTVLLLIFSFQLAPVLQVGSFLYQGQLTEELPHHSDSGSHSGGSNSDSAKNLIPSSVDQLLPGILHSLPNLSYTLSEEAYSSRHADDVQTPPPNTHA
jgi:hypothetical protein